MWNLQKNVLCVLRRMFYSKKWVKNGFSAAILSTKYCSVSETQWLSVKKTFWTQRPVKVLLTLIWDMKWPIDIDLLEKDESVDRVSYCEIFVKFTIVIECPSRIYINIYVCVCVCMCMWFFYIRKYLKKYNLIFFFVKLNLLQSVLSFYRYYKMWTLSSQEWQRRQRTACVPSPPPAIGLCIV